MFKFWIEGANTHTHNEVTLGRRTTGTQQVLYMLHTRVEAKTSTHEAYAHTTSYAASGTVDKTRKQHKSTTQNPEYPSQLAQTTVHHQCIYSHQIDNRSPLLASLFSPTALALAYAHASRRAHLPWRGSPLRPRSRSAARRGLPPSWGGTLSGPGRRGPLCAPPAPPRGPPSSRCRLLTGETLEELTG